MARDYSRFVLAAVIFFTLSGFLVESSFFAKTARAAIVKTSTAVIWSFIPVTNATSSLSALSEGSVLVMNTDQTFINCVVPPNSFSENVKAEVFSYFNDVFKPTLPPPPDQNFAGKVYEFQFHTFEGSLISTLSNSAAMTIAYSDFDVSGLDEATLAPYRKGANDSSWSLIPGAVVDAVNNKVTFSTQSFSLFTLFAKSLPPPPPAPSSFIGGGGGGAPAPPAPPLPLPGAVVLSGKAYPLSLITVLQDGKVMTNDIRADQDANFSIKFDNITPGVYTFGIWSWDKNGAERSITFSFTTNVAQGTLTTIGGIFLPPTLTLDKQQVQKGEIVNFLGQTAPQSEVTLQINSGETIEKKANADKDGFWSYAFDTSAVEEDTHLAKAKATSLDGLLSTFSNTVSFVVGGKKEQALKQTDLNSDKKVNLIDFSILLFNWGAPKNPIADLNNDGKVNITDFSILLFWWTG
ncbi:MAG: hypothetical protein HYS15_01225 [Candidatus Spechtbacteria bacterium]|nr:hypothetical protein [Candidatus Spechtbacteria bacterium]